MRRIMYSRITFLLLFISAPYLGAAQSPKRFHLPKDLIEVSGLFYAGKDSLWWHNDSGRSPTLFLTDGRGKLLTKRDLHPLTNRDWEDITSDPSGNIYIGDFGNNANNRKDLKVYILSPDKRIDSLLFQYPDQKRFPPPAQAANFDMEAFFWYADSLHLFSKNKLVKGNYFTKHYRLPARPGTYTADLQDSLYLKKRVITGAAVSPDGRRVALVAYNFKRFLGFIPTSAASVLWFDDFSGTKFLQGTMHKVNLACLLATQYESIDFEDNDRVIVASERTVIIPQKARRIRLKR